MKKFTFILLSIFIATWSFSQSGKSPKKSVYISTIPKPTAPPDLQISQLAFKDIYGNNNNKLDADEHAELCFRIQNIGEGPAYCLKLSLLDKNAIKGIDYGREKTLGDLKPGESQSVTLPIAATMQLETSKAAFEISISEGNHFNADPFIITFNTQEFKNPDLEIAEYLFTANEEGKIKLGSTITLTIILQNKGQGEANDIKVSFINPENVFPANESCFNIGKLTPNQSKNIAYEFFANKKYQNHEISIQVIISESYKKYGENKTLSVSLDDNLSKTQQIVDIQSSPENNISIETLSLTSDVDKNIPVCNSCFQNKFALIIGNEDYASYQNDLSSEVNVEFAQNDARIFKEYCIKTLGIPENNISFLLNATTGKMYQAIDKINKLIKTTNGNADVLVYYAGHGLPDEVTGEPYLIPVDVSGSDISSAIKLSYFYEKLTEYPSHKVIVFLDACFSGGARNAGLIAGRSVKVKPKEDIITGNLCIFTSSSGEQSSLPWKEKHHGMFTYFLLKKLQETKGKLSLSDLGSYIKDQVSFESIRTNNKEQNPQVFYSDDIKDLSCKWKLVE